MFNNPLRKYQVGGSAPEQAENEFVNAIAEQLTDGNATPEIKKQVKTRLEQIKADPKASEILKSGLQKLQNDDASGMQEILSLFQPQKAKSGGKIHSFICKHANGKKIADCGCGNKVPKAEMGLPRVGDHSPKPANINIPIIPGLIAEFRQRKVANSGNATNRNFSRANWHGNQYFLERANIDGSTADTWIQVTPKLDTLVEQILPSGRRTPLTVEQAQSIVDRNRNDINSKENGGILKGQYGLPGFTGVVASTLNKDFLAKQNYNPNTTNNTDIISEPTSLESRVNAMTSSHYTPSVTATTQTPAVASEPASINPLDKFTDEQLMADVLRGKYGNGAARRNALGDRYAAVQALINKRYRKPAPAVETPAAQTEVQQQTNITSKEPFEQPRVIRSGRDANGNYYEVTSGVEGRDANGNWYTRVTTTPNTYRSRIQQNPGISPNWMRWRKQYGGIINKQETIPILPIKKTK